MLLFLGLVEYEYCLRHAHFHPMILEYIHLWSLQAGSHRIFSGPGSIGFRLKSWERTYGDDSVLDKSMAMKFRPADLLYLTRGTLIKGKKK